MVNRKLADIVKDKKFVVLPEEGTVQEACRCMWECRVGSVLIADKEQRLTGIFTAATRYGRWRKARTPHDDAGASHDAQSRDHCAGMPRDRRLT